LRRPRRHQRVGRDIGAVADHRVLVDDRLVMNDHVATEDAARQARTTPGLDAVPVDHAFEHRAALDHAAVADDQRADELRLGLDEATRADEHGRLDAHARIDLRPRADPHAGLDLASRHVELDAAGQRVEVAEPVLLDVADAPIYCWRLESYWNDVGNIEQYRLSNFDALLGRVKLDVPGRQIQPRVWVGPGTQIDPGVRIEAPVLIGAGCLVESEAELIGPLIVGDGCV